MSSIQDTIYPQLQKKYSEKQLTQSFLLTEEEHQFIEEATYQGNSTSRLCFAILFKCFSHLGYFVKLEKVPIEVSSFIAQQIRFDFDIQSIILYDQSKTRKRHQKKIRAYFQLSNDPSFIQEVIHTTATQSAKKKENIVDIINDVIEELLHQYCELPGYTTIERKSRLIRNQVNNGYIGTIFDQILPKEIAELEKLLEIENTDTISKWNVIKAELKKPTDSNIKEYISNHLWIKDIADKLPELNHLPAGKIERFYEEAMAVDKSILQKMKQSKRVALMAIFLKSKVKKSIDELVDVYIKIINKLFRTAKKEVDAYYLDHAKTTDFLIEQYEKALQAVQVDQQEALGLLQVNNDYNLSLCRKHIAAAKSNQYYYLLPLFKKKRKLIFDCISLLDIASTTSDHSLIHCLSFIKDFRSSRKEWIEDCLPMNLHWLPDEAKSVALGSTNKQKVIHKVHRNYLEISVFYELSRSLKSLDLYVKGSFEYEDYRSQLIDAETYTQKIKSYTLRLNFSKNSHEFVHQLKEGLRSSIQITDTRFQDNSFLDFEKGHLVIRKSTKRERHKDYQKVDLQLKQKLVQVSILDVLISVNKSVSLTKDFSLHSGYESKIREYDKHLLCTLFSYGCNLGPVQTERSLKEITQSQISWINRMHITESKLSKENTKIINKYHELELPTFWGDKKSLSVDGTHWNVFSQNSFSEYHIRYGKYGGIGYYHVSDTYIALFSHFIPCGVYEAVFVLDGIINNQTQFKPNKIHGDTHAQNEAIFGLSFLLGIELMPRIRSLKELNFYKPDEDIDIKNIDSLFHKVINWPLIKRHYDDMFKVAISIMEGKITASHFMKRLTRKSRRNKLYLAFKELGKVVRTKFLMHYLNSLELRNQIHQGTVKSEEFNHFTKWVSFGSNNTIRENRRYEQLKIIKYNHLVTNAVILYNTHQMSKILNEMIDEGTLKSTDVFKDLSPYRTEHINRFGEYNFNMNFPGLDI